MRPERAPTATDAGRGHPNDLRSVESHDVVARVCEGNHAAVEELYRRYAKPLYRYMVVALQNREAAEDAVHEVFARALRALPRYEHRGAPFRTWLFRIARNYLLDLARSRRDETRHPGEIRRLIETRTSGAKLESLAHLDDEEFLRLIRALPLSQRRVLLLRYVFDMPFAEIAAIVGSSEAAARNQQRRAFAVLRPRLQARRDRELSVMRLSMSLRFARMAA